MFDVGAPEKGSPRSPGYRLIQSIEVVVRPVCQARFMPGGAASAAKVAILRSVVMAGDSGWFA